MDLLIMASSSELWRMRSSDNEGMLHLGSLFSVEIESLRFVQEV